MAMTKAERQRMEALEHELALERAFRLGSPVETDVAPPAGNEPDSFGYTINHFAKAIFPARTGAVSHAVGHAGGFEFPHRNAYRAPHGIALFSTRAKALRALRFKVARDAAEHLLRIDEQLALAENSNIEEGIEE